MILLAVMFTAIVASGFGGGHQISRHETLGVLRGPYLQLPTKDGITVVWADSEATSYQVRYGPHWTSVGFDDSQWDRGGCGQSPEGMPVHTSPRGRQLPAYMRHVFHLSASSEIDEASLLLRKGAGKYTAYLNGARIAQGGSNSNDPEEGLEKIDIANSVHLLREGENVIAIHTEGGLTPPAVSLMFGLELRRSGELQRLGPGQWRYVLSESEPAVLNQVAEVEFRYLSSIGSEYQYHATITGLSSDGTYAYQIVRSTNPQRQGRVHRFRTISESSGFTFIAFGDLGAGTTGQSAIRNRLLEDEFDVAIITGDVSEQDGSYGSYQTTFFPTYAELIANKPFIPVAGNTDYLTNHGAPLRDLFMLPANGPDENAEQFFSFDYGSVHFIGLDSEDIGAEQVAWLERDLASTSQPWIVVYLHRHAFGEGGRHPIDEIPSVFVRRLLVPLFEEYGVDLVLSGHNGIYGRSAPLTDGQATPPYARSTNASEGVVYVTTGGGGGDIPGPVYVDAFHQAPVGTSFSGHHYTRVAVSQCVLRLEAIDIAGSVRDRFQMDRCP